MRRRLTAMVAEDVAAFDGLLAAYKLPGPPTTIRRAASRAIEAGQMRRSHRNTSLTRARACAEVIALARRASEHGYLNVISDGGVGVLAGFTGLRSAALNVYINAPALKDREFAAQATAELEKLVKVCAAESEAVYALVRNKLG